MLAHRMLEMLFRWGGFYPGQGKNSQEEGNGINWQDYNYPPHLRVIHYNQSEIPSSISDITKFQKSLSRKPATPAATIEIPLQGDSNLYAF